jgi:8-oxo-dGTP pyrophosphatase MutT (NUDIX family)
VVSGPPGGGATVGPVEPGEPGEPDVVAAGGILVRPGRAGPEVLVVHRPRYDDWSFPKGKQDPGETAEQTARREVLEETGITVTLGPYLGVVRYRDHRDRPKVVHYWQMAPGPEPPATPDDEVDRLLWCAPEAAARLLTYPHDRALLGRLEGHR